MKLTIELTADFVEVPVSELPDVMCRVWRGTSEHGTEVMVLVMALSPQTFDPEKLREFESELFPLTPDDNDG